MYSAFAGIVNRTTLLPPAVVPVGVASSISGRIVAIYHEVPSGKPADFSQYPSCALRPRCTPRGGRLKPAHSGDVRVCGPLREPDRQRASLPVPNDRERGDLVGIELVRDDPHEI